MIVQKAPKNGAEIMEEMESGSRGWWRPSPGSVYPMLHQMVQEGLVKKRESDGKYEITPQGTEEVEWPSRMRQESPQSVTKMLDEMSSNISYLEDLVSTKDKRVSESAGQIKELASRLARVGGGA